MSNVADSELYKYAHKVKGQTVLITGAANGIGKEAALQFAKRGVNVVIGDIDVDGANKTVSQIKSSGGNAVAGKCNVLEWDDQLALFELAVSTFGSVDVVVANAGVTEIGRFTNIETDEQGRPKKPRTKTLEINLLSVTYTACLAIHHFRKNQNPNSVKSIVFISSMAGLSGITGAPMYGASKHGVLGFMRALRDEVLVEGIRVASIHPWFADTAIVPVAMKLFMAGIPQVPVPRIAGAIFLAATDAPETHGAAYTLPDEKEVFRIPHVELNEGVYKMINNRAKRAIGIGHTIKFFIVATQILFRYAPVKIAFVASLAYAAGKAAGYI